MFCRYTRFMLGLWLQWHRNLPGTSPLKHASDFDRAVIRHARTVYIDLFHRSYHDRLMRLAKCRHRRDKERKGAWEKIVVGGTRSHKVTVGQGALCHWHHTPPTHTDTHTSNIKILFEAYPHKKKWMIARSATLLVLRARYALNRGLLIMRIVTKLQVIRIVYVTGLPLAQRSIPSTTEVKPTSPKT